MHCIRAFWANKNIEKGGKKTNNLTKKNHSPDRNPSQSYYFTLNVTSMNPSNGIRVYVYKKGGGVIPSDVRLFGNDWIEFEIKVDEQDRSRPMWWHWSFCTLGR